MGGVVHLGEKTERLDIEISEDVNCWFGGCGIITFEIGLVNPLPGNDFSAASSWSFLYGNALGIWAFVK